MIFWNMKYLFYNCLLLLLCCACCKFAIQAFVQEDRQEIQTKLAKAWQFYRRIDWWLGTCRYFTESCKKITEFFHNCQRLYWRTGNRRYFTESCKKITAPATIIDGYPDAFTNRWSTFQRVRPSDCLVGRQSTDGFANGRGKSNAPVLWHIVTDGFADGRQKIWRDFQNFSVNFKKIPTEFKATAKKILFYFSSVISSVKLQYKTDPPSVVHFFTAPLISSLLLLSVQIICVFHCIFIVLIVVFNILKGIYSPFFIFVFVFTFFYFNYDYFCCVFCFVYCL